MTLYFAVTVSCYSHTGKYSQPNSHEACLILDVHFRMVVQTQATIDRNYPFFLIRIPECSVSWQNSIFSATLAHWLRLDFSKKKNHFYWILLYYKISMIILLLRLSERGSVQVANLNPLEKLSFIYLKWYSYRKIS